MKKFKCLNCSQDIEETFSFCPNCGSLIRQMEEIVIDRYVPKSLNATQIINIILQYGVDNDSLESFQTKETEHWKIIIIVKKEYN